MVIFFLWQTIFRYLVLLLEQVSLTLVNHILFMSNVGYRCWPTIDGLTVVYVPLSDIISECPLYGLCISLIAAAIIGSTDHPCIN